MQAKQNSAIPSSSFGVAVPGKRPACWNRKKVAIRVLFAP
jgi:hypothetical protein